MSSWRSWALLVLALAAFVVLFVYVRTRPMVSDDELSEAALEVARIRAGLDAAECVRPATFESAFAPSASAMPLRDFLRLDGPMAKCWAFEDRDCADFPEELARQAQAADRCAPFLPDREVGAYDSLMDTRRHPFLYRVRSLADEASGDDGLRLLVQGMVVGRDLTQGPTGFDQAHWGAEIETRLGAAFIALLATTTPSAEARAELHHALGVLAEMPINVNTFLSGEAAEHAEGWQPAAASGGGMMSREQSRWMAYGTAAVLRRLQEWCPPGGSVRACISRLPRTQPTSPNDLPTGVLGKRALRREILEYSLWSSSFDYPTELMALEALRTNARTLQQTLRWSQGDEQAL